MPKVSTPAKRIFTSSIEAKFFIDKNWSPEDFITLMKCINYLYGYHFTLGYNHIDPVYLSNTKEIQLYKRQLLKEVYENARYDPFTSSIIDKDLPQNINDKDSRQWTELINNNEINVNTITIYKEDKELDSFEVHLKRSKERRLLKLAELSLKLKSLKSPNKLTESPSFLKRNIESNINLNESHKPSLLRIQYASPSSLDWAGMSAVFLLILSTFKYYLPNRVNKLKAEKIHLENQKLEIENLKLLGYTDVQIQKLTLRKNISEENLIRLIKEGKLVDIKLVESN